MLLLSKFSIKYSSAVLSFRIKLIIFFFNSWPKGLILNFKYGNKPRLSIYPIYVSISELIIGSFNDSKLFSSIVPEGLNSLFSIFNILANLLVSIEDFSLDIVNSILNKLFFFCL